MNWRRVSAIARKDLKEVTGSRQVTAPMAVVTVVMCVLMPAIVLLAALNVGEEGMGNLGAVAKLADRYPVPALFTAMVDRVLFVLLNYTFLPLFMIIPLMVSSIIAANSIVGEKERGTLETLLYTPVTNRELIVAKLMSSFVPATIVTGAGFAGYFLVSNAIFWAYRAHLIVRSFIWLPSLVLLAPAVSLLGLSATLLFSLRAKTSMEAQQTSAFVVIPFVVLLYAQVGGLVILGPLFVVIMAAVAFAASYVIYGRIGPRFSREQILKRM